MGLTVKEIEASKPREKGYKLADREGLYLFVTPAGGRSWRANYTAAGKQGTRTYGMYPAMSLADARKAHQSAKAPEAEGGAARKKVSTFKEASAAWLAKKLPELSNPKHKIQVEKTLERHVYPSIGRLRLDEITRTQLVEVVRDLGATNETAHRVAGRITAVFDYAMDSGEISQHPASGLTRILPARVNRRPMPSIPPAEAGALLRAIDGYGEEVSRLGLQLMAHTFVRVRELTGMRWSELREDGAIWVVPEERMKLRLPHVVPLAPQARRIIEQLHAINGHSDLVLESPMRRGQPMSENTLLFALYGLGYRGRMTVHGFRALASTVLNEKSGFHHDVIERQLAHKEVDAVRASYNRAQYLDQRREMMAWWAGWLEGQWRDGGRKRASA